jgi:hypothetical protein
MGLDLLRKLNYMLVVHFILLFQPFLQFPLILYLPLHVLHHNRYFLILSCRLCLQQTDILLQFLIFLTLLHPFVYLLLKLILNFLYTCFQLLYLSRFYLLYLNELVASLFEELLDFILVVLGFDLYRFYLLY